MLNEAVTCFTEVAPDCKMVISKVIPVGEREIDTDRVIFSAEVEKRLTEINKSDIRFLDHGNLSERGVPINEYYRQDQLHLSGRGIAVFAENLEKEIRHILKKDNLHDNMRMSTSMHPTDQHGFRRDNRREQYSNRDRPQGPSGMHNVSNGRSAYRRDVRTENQRDQYTSRDRRPYRPIKPDVFTNHHIQTAERKTLNDIGTVMIARGDTATNRIRCHIIGLSTVETEMIIIIKHKVIQIIDIIQAKDLTRGYKVT